MRVGLLEDDASIQEMLTLVLQEEGYHVAVFSTAAACLEALGITGQNVDVSPVDVMIIDWRLSGSINGTEVIDLIRQQPSLDTLPIILTTAATLTNIDELQKLDVVLLEKPFSVEDMIALIKTLVRPSS